MQDTERNAVTWGVFPGQEIVQSTIIEQESFLTWKVRSLILSRSIPVFEQSSVTGRGVFNLDRLGVEIPSRLTGATVIGRDQRFPLAGPRYTPRLQKL
jgi:hypothetical protein